MLTEDVDEGAKVAFLRKYRCELRNDTAVKPSALS